MSDARAEPAQAGLDGILDRAEKTIGRLADSRLPLEDLVAAYEEAGRLLGEAEKRFGELRVRSNDG